MKRINMSVDDKIYEAIHKKAKSYGKKPTTYAAELILHAFHQKQDDGNLKEQFNMIKALIPALVGIVGIPNKMTNEQLQALTAKAQKIWEEAYIYEKTKIS